jgi:hypothetical protein
MKAGSFNRDACLLYRSAPPNPVVKICKDPDSCKIVGETGISFAPFASGHTDGPKFFDTGKEIRLW